MNRNQFIRNSALSTWGILILSKPDGLFNMIDPDHSGVKTETAGELNAFLRSLVDVEEPSVDRIVIGNPSTKIRKIGTCWLARWETLQKAVQQDVNVMVVHEPTFYTHWDLDDLTQDFYRAPDPARSQYVELVEKKKKWILEQGMVIIRCHDVLDKMGEIGIPFALGAALGFHEKDIQTRAAYYNVYKIKPTRADEVARNIAHKLEPLNQPGVAFYGDKNRMVSTVGVGTGCICDPMHFAHLNPDMYIAISDIVRTWIQTSFAEDSGKPLVVIDHGTAEESGMQLLSELLQKRIPGYKTVHFPQGCTYQWIS